MKLDICPPHIRDAPWPVQKAVANDMDALIHNVQEQWCGIKRASISVMLSWLQGRMTRGRLPHFDIGCVRKDNTRHKKPASTALHTHS
jgi:hypothetical protein